MSNVFFSVLLNQGHKLISRINCQRINIVFVDSIIIILHFVGLISILLTNELHSSQDAFRTNFLTVLYNANLFYLCNQYFQIQVAWLSIAALMFHISLYALYLLVLFCEIKNISSVFLKIIVIYIGFIHQIYNWLLYVPCLLIYLNCIINPGGYLYGILSLLGICLAIFTVSLVHFTEIDLNYLPKNLMTTRFSNLKTTLSIEQFFLAITKVYISQYMGDDTVVITLSVLFATIIGVLYVADLPFCNEQISFVFGSMSLLYFYMSTLLFCNTAGIHTFEIIDFFVFGVFVSIVCTHVWRSSIVQSILLMPDISKLSNSRFDYLMRKVCSMTKSSFDKKQATLYLSVFIRTHVLTCIDKNCECKNVTMVKDLDMTENLLEKSTLVLQYKDLITSLILQYYQKRESGNVELQIVTALYISQQLRRNSISFTKVFGICQSHHSFNFKAQMELMILSEELEQKLYSKPNPFGVRYLREVIEYFEDCTKCKKTILSFLDNYTKLISIVADDVIDFDLLIRQQTKLTKIAVDIRKLVASLTRFNPYSEDVRCYVENYHLLEILESAQLAEEYKKLTNDCKITKKAETKDTTVHEEKIDMFNEGVCVILFGTSGRNIGQILKYTPSFKKIFRYNDNEIQSLKFGSLVPDPFFDQKEDFIATFLDYCYLPHFDQIFKGLPVIDKSGFIFLVDVYFRLENLLNEICMAVYVHKIHNEKEYLLLNDRGMINYCSDNFKDYVAYDDLQSINIGMLCPKLYLSFIYDMKVKEKIGNVFGKSGSINDVGNVKSSNITDDFIYLICPKNYEYLKSWITNIKSIANSPAAKNIELSYRNPKVFMKLTSLFHEIFITYKSIYVNIYKANVTLKPKKINDGSIKLRFHEIRLCDDADPEDVIKNHQQFLHALHDFIERPSSTVSLRKLKQGLQKITPTSLDRHESIPNLSMKLRRTLIKIPAGKENSSSKNESLQEESKEDDMDDDNHDLGNSNDSLDDDLDDKQDGDKDNKGNDRNYHGANDNEGDNNSNDGRDNRLGEESDASHNYREEEDLKKNGTYIFSHRSHVDPLISPAGYFVASSFRANSSGGNYRETAGLLLGQDADPIIKRSTSAGTNLSPILKNQSAKLILVNENSQKRITYESKNDFVKDALKSSKKKVYENVSDDDESEKEEIMNAKASVGSGHSTRSSAERDLKYLLLKEINVKGLNQLFIFGVIQTLILLGMILTLFLLFYVNLGSYFAYISNADFPDKFIATLGVYGKHMAMSMLANDNQFVNLNYTDMLNKSMWMLQDKDQYFRSVYSSAMVTQDLFLSSKLNYDNYSMNIWQLDPTGAENLYNIPFVYAMISLLDYMEAVRSMNQSSFYTNQSIVYYWRKNFPTYFETLIEVTSDVGGSLYSGSVGGDIKEFAIDALIVSLIISFIFVYQNIPAHKFFEKKQHKGLSLLVTLQSNDLKAITVKIEEVKRRLEGSNIQNSIKYVKSLGQTLGKKNHPSKRKARDWKMQETSRVKLLALLLIVYGIFATYFSLNCTRVISHHANFIQFYYEFDLMTDVYASYDSNYFTSYSQMFLYNDTPSWQEYYQNQYGPVYQVFNDRYTRAHNFWMNIDDYLQNNSDVLAPYIAQELFLKNENTCDFITIVQMTPQMMSECKLALEQLTQLNFIHLIDGIASTLQMITTTVVSSNFSRSETVDLISTLDFKGLDNLLFYGDLIFRQYIEGIRSNLNAVLQRQFAESYIFLVVGIAIVIAEYAATITLIKYTQEKFINIKKMFSLLPLKLLITNPYIPKWLIENSVTTM